MSIEINELEEPKIEGYKWTQPGFHPADFMFFQAAMLLGLPIQMRLIPINGLTVREFFVAEDSLENVRALQNQVQNTRIGILAWSAIDRRPLIIKQLLIDCNQISLEDSQERKTGFNSSTLVEPRILMDGYVRAYEAVNGFKDINTGISLKPDLEPVYDDFKSKGAYPITDEEIYTLIHNELKRILKISAKSEEL